MVPEPLSCFLRCPGSERDGGEEGRGRGFIRDWELRIALTSFP